MPRIDAVPVATPRCQPPRVSANTGGGDADVEALASRVEALLPHARCIGISSGGNATVKTLVGPNAYTAFSLSLQAETINANDIAKLPLEWRDTSAVGLTSPVIVCLVSNKFGPQQAWAVRPAENVAYSVKADGAPVRRDASGKPITLPLSSVLSLARESRST